jgi:hypothetical protein
LQLWILRVPVVISSPNPDSENRNVAELQPFESARASRGRIRFTRMICGWQGCYARQGYISSDLSLACRTRIHLFLSQFDAAVNISSHPF